MIGRSGNAGERARPRRSSARSGAPGSTTTATAPARRSCGSRTWTATACAASVIYGPLVARLPDRRPRAAGRVLRGVERLGGRGVQRGRARSAVRARVPARPLARGRRGRARALRGARPPRRDHRRVRHRPRRPGLGPAVGGRGRTPALPISFHIKGGTSSKLSYRIGKWQSAAFATLLPLQLDEPLATMVFCGALERHPGPEARARGVGHRLAAVLPRAHGPRVARAAATSSTTRRRSPPSELFRRQVIATFEEEPLGRAAHPAARRRLVHVGVRLSAHRQHVPELAARDRGDARRAARRRPPQDHRDQLRAALRLRRMTDRDGAIARLRPRVAADAGHRRDGGVLPRARVRRRRAAARRVGATSATR